MTHLRRHHLVLFALIPCLALTWLNQTPLHVREGAARDALGYRDTSVNNSDSGLHSPEAVPGYWCPAIVQEGSTGRKTGHTACAVPREAKRTLGLTSGLSGTKAFPAYTYNRGPSRVNGAAIRVRRRKHSEGRLQVGDSASSFSRRPGAIMQSCCRPSIVVRDRAVLDRRDHASRYLRCAHMHALPPANPAAFHPPDTHSRRDPTVPIWSRDPRRRLLNLKATAKHRWIGSPGCFLRRGSPNAYIGAEAPIARDTIANSVPNPGSGVPIASGATRDSYTWPSLSSPFETRRLRWTPQGRSSSLGYKERARARCDIVRNVQLCPHDGSSRAHHVAGDRWLGAVAVLAELRGGFGWALGLQVPRKCP
ncbi:uncharacterized protein B0H18DRAFT_1169479 [Fomitopsis serialis]|uniref:uncharacterized protein n=1 Tax=Fomitopsis serialis TaxID=139415 RepID=UPI0020086B44|nr:uncharacterized protein B0H18DRAFT_1169479 [Neoantrodia serialis]KAH9925813.1 hypothetical protein B0H18DRAFT_1169479 [Neoantrodia serialis]